MDAELPSAETGLVNTGALPPQVYWGAKTAQVLPQVLRRLGKSHALLMVSRSLRSTRVMDEICTSLGDMLASIWDGMPPHTSREAVLEAADVVRACGADVVVTLGGGSLTDGAKVTRIAYATGASTPDALGRCNSLPGASVRVTHMALIPQVTVPTTLSAGEFTALAGCKNSTTQIKEPYFCHDAVPKAIILDPQLTVHTPEWLFLSTGLRSVDHCVECLCSHRGNPYSDGLASAALASLVRGLRGVKADPMDVRARSLCQLGMFQAAQAIWSGTPMGASHAIGHIMGPAFDVPHGYTSCVALPGVLRWNAERSENLPRQKLVVKAFAEGKSHDQPVTASQCVLGLVKELGLPASLAEVGVERSQLEECARKTMEDPWAATNPRKIGSWQDVLAILEICGPFAEEQTETKAVTAKL